MALGYIPRGYFNPLLRLSAKACVFFLLGNKGMCRERFLKTFVRFMTFKASTKKYMDINVCSFLICLWNINLGKRGLISNRALTWNV